jgi:hypothetical protein
MNLDLKNRAVGVGHRIMTGVGVVAGLLISLGEYLQYIPVEYRSSKWYLVAAALVALGTALKLPGKKDLPAAPAALVLGLLLFAGAARADDALVPAGGVCLNAKNTICFRPVLGVSGAIYDFTARTVAHDVQIGGGYELTIIPEKLGVAAGPALNLGDNVNFSVWQGITIPFSMIIGVRETLLGDKSVHLGIFGGYIKRF